MLVAALVAAGVALILGTASPNLAQGWELPYCEIELIMWNRNRRVYGPVSAECTYGCPWPNFVHSHPFGNWGVDSNMGGRYDGEQYRGWAPYNPYCTEDLNPREWNSCTEFGVGDPQYFNFAGYTEQFKASEGYHAVEYRYLQTVEPYDSDGDGWYDCGGCRDWDGVEISMGGNSMALYELDSLGGDEYVTTLSFPDTSVTLSCPNYDHCVLTYSPWQASYSNSVAANEIRLSAMGTFVYR